MIVAFLAAGENHACYGRGCKEKVKILGMKLIIINGPWGVGKSTAARLLHASLFGSFHLELDVLRKSISGYERDRQKSFFFSVTLAKQMMAACFDDGRDVIVDKMFFSSEVLDDILATAQDHGATVHEIILWSDNRTLLTRGAQRGYSSGVFSIEKAQRSWDLIERLIPERLNATVINTATLTPIEVQGEIERIIG